MRHMHVPPPRAAQLSCRRHLDRHLLTLCGCGRFAGLRPLGAVRRAGRLSALQGRSGRERQDQEEQPISEGPPAPPWGASQPDIIGQLLAFQRDAGLAVHPNRTKWQHPEQRCPLCPPMFSRTLRDGREFVTDSASSSGDLSNMIVDGLRQVSFDTSLFSGISARREGLSTAIEAGVPACRNISSGCRAATRRTSRRGDTSSSAASAAIRPVGGLRPLNSDRTPTSSALFRATREWPFGPDQGLGPLRFRDPDRPTRGGPRSDRQGHGGHTRGYVTRGRDHRPPALPPAPHPYVSTPRSKQVLGLLRGCVRANGPLLSALPAWDGLTAGRRQTREAHWRAVFRPPDHQTFSSTPQLARVPCESQARKPDASGFRLISPTLQDGKDGIALMGRR